MKIEVSLSPRYLGTHNICNVERESDGVCRVNSPWTFYLHRQRRSTTTIKSRTLEPVWNETLTDKHRYDSWLHREWHSGWSWIQADASGSNKHRWRFCNHCERSCLNPAVCLHIILFLKKYGGSQWSPRVLTLLTGKEPGDSLSFKIWDYDKAANNDLLAEGILDGSQFHKPGWATEQLEILSRCLHTQRTHTYIYIIIYIHTYVLCILCKY